MVDAYHSDNEECCGLPPQGLLCALDAVPMGIVITDPTAPDNPITFVNSEFCRITGYARDEVIGRNLRILEGADSDQDVAARLRRAIDQRKAVAIELLTYRKNGEPLIMKVALRPILDPTGRLSAIVGALTDITEQRRAKEALEESEERLRAVMGAIPLPMLTLKQDGTIARANSAAHETLGVAPNSLPGRSVYDFVPPEECNTGCPLACQDLKANGNIRHTELRARRQDGQLLWVLITGRQFTVRGETRILATFQDVTELKRKERELTEANEEAERNIRARMRFLAAASHDLRQPLQAMALFTSALDHHIATPQGQTIVHSLKTSLRSMEEMFDSLLDMSKLDAGVMRAEPRTFLINDILEQVEMTYGNQAEAAGLDFRVVPSSAVIHSDPRLLARIVGNFVSNAIRYTRHGRVLVGIRRRGDRAQVMVLDTGPGIPEDQRLEIFREFAQGSHRAGRERGAGLGLAIVQRLAMLLGHRLDVRSVVGRGSAFSIEVPLADEEALGPTAAEEDEDMRDVEGATVMVVDDDRDIQDGLSMLLKEWGCHAVITASENEALAAMRAQQLTPDVVLADVHLEKGGSGLAAITAIRTQAGQEVPAFLFTGDTEYPAEVGNHVRVMRKPLNPVRLRTMLADALGR